MKNFHYLCILFSLMIVFISCKSDKATETNNLLNQKSHLKSLDDITNYAFVAIDDFDQPILYMRYFKNNKVVLIRSKGNYLTSIWDEPWEIFKNSDHIEIRHNGTTLRFNKSTLELTWGEYFEIKEKFSTHSFYMVPLNEIEHSKVKEILNSSYEKLDEKFIFW